MVRSVCHESWAFPANTTRWNNDVLMLAQRLRRWASIKTSLFQRVVLAGILLLCYLCEIYVCTGHFNKQLLTYLFIYFNPTLI